MMNTAFKRKTFSIAVVTSMLPLSFFGFGCGESSPAPCTHLLWKNEEGELLMRTVFTRAECGELADGLSSLVPIVIQGGGDELDDASRLLRGFAEDDGVYEDWQERYEEFTNEHLRDVPEVPGGGDTGFLLRKKIIDMTLEPRSKGGFGALIMMEFRIGMPELPNTVQNSSWEEALAGMKRDGMPAHIGRLRNGYPVAWSENAPSPMRGSRRIEVFRQGLDTPIGVDRNYVHLLDVKHSPMPQSE